MRWKMILNQALLLLVYLALIPGFILLLGLMSHRNAFTQVYVFCFVVFAFQAVRIFFKDYTTKEKLFLETITVAIFFGFQCLLNVVWDAWGHHL